jgi:hypothetical protein
VSVRIVQEAAWSLEQVLKVLEKRGTPAACSGSKTFSGKFCIVSLFIFCFSYLSPSFISTAIAEAIFTAALLAEVNSVSLYSCKNLQILWFK